MATIKSLLEKAMLRLGSRGGRNSDVQVFITVNQSSEGFQWFTAPTDGTYEADGIATSDVAYMWLDDGSYNNWSCKSLFNNGSMIFSFPVKKGARAGIQWIHIKERHLTFVKSIGGNS